MRQAPELQKCTLLGGTFAIFVQVSLAVSAVMTLVYKRATEHPRRPWLVWFFDASKQGWAGLLQHGVNLGFGMYFAGQGSTASECAWYLTNFCISVVCGVALLWLAMIAYQQIVDRFQLTLLRSGEYGTPPSVWAWLAQMVVWGLIASGEKFITAAVVILPLHPKLDAIAAWLERPLIPYPNIELLLVMVLSPVLLNAIFFYAIDNIIMRKRAKLDTDDDIDEDKKVFPTAPSPA